MERTSTSQFINHEASSECLMHFQRMRLRREMVDTFIKKILRGHGEIELNWKRFSFDAVEAAVNYAYTGKINLTPQIATKLYLLAHNLRSQTIINWCTEYLKFTVNNDNATEVWLAANATKNEILIGACAHLVVLNWAIFSRNNLIGVNTEVIGIKEIVKCTQTSGITLKAKLNLISAWISSARDAEERDTRIEAFHNLIQLLQIQQTPDIFVDLYADSDEMQLPIESRKLLAWTWKESRKFIEQPITSSSSMLETDLNATNQVYIALIELGYGECQTYVKIIKPKSAEVVAEHKLPDRCCYSAISFQNKLVFVGGYSKNHGHLRRVDSMDPITGRLSSLPDMLLPKCQPHCASNDRQIFVFGDQLSGPCNRFSSEFYDNENNEWLPLPPMKVERCGHAAVSIPNMGLLVVGGRGKDGKDLRAAEILRSESREGQEWLKWKSTAPMLRERGSPLAAYFRQTVYVLGAFCDVNDIEMLNVSMGDCNQWTSLKPFGMLSHNFFISRLIQVGDELLFEGTDGDIYVVEMDTDPKIQHEKVNQMKQVPNLHMQFFLEAVTVRLQGLQ